MFLIFFPVLTMVGLVGGGCYHGQSFSFFVDARLILSTENTRPRTRTTQPLKKPQEREIAPEERGDFDYKADKRNHLAIVFWDGKRPMIGPAGCSAQVRLAERREAP